MLTVKDILCLLFAVACLLAISWALEQVGFDPLATFVIGSAIYGCIAVYVIGDRALNPRLWSSSPSPWTNTTAISTRS